MQLSNNIVHTGVTFSQANYIEYNNGNKDVFEQVIDDAIFDKYYNTKKIECDFIKTLPRSKKRIGLLKLAGNDNILWDKIRNIHSSNDTKFNKVKSIIVLLRDYVKTVDVSKKEHGEVLTPFNELAKPMVNLMDKYDDAFWGNPKNKVLDSSAGYGTFLILCLYKFMEGLSKYRDISGSSIIEITKRGETKHYDLSIEDERLKYVIEQQLYYGELQSKSVFSWLVAIDIYDEHDANIYWGSYLEEGFDYHMKNVWEVEKFDLIIQNPPYQMQKPGFTKTQPIWHLFVNKSLNILTENGYMIMVHPGGWKNIDGSFKDTQRAILSRDIYYLNINTFKDGSDLFGAKTDFDYYFIKNSNKNILTNIIDIDNEEYFLNLKEVEFIPSCKLNEVYSLVAKNGEEKVNLIHSYSFYDHRKKYLSKCMDDVYNLPCIYSIKSPDKGNIPVFLYSNINKGHFGEKKVIWASGATGIIIDSKGEYGMCEFTQGIVDDVDNLENIKTALLNDYFIKYIMGHRNSLGNKYNNKIISTFRKDFWKEFI